MQRPTLNPTIFDDPDRQPDPTAVMTVRSVWSIFRDVVRLFIRGLDRVRGWALIPVFSYHPVSVETAENRSDGWFYLLTRLMIWLTGMGMTVLIGVAVQVYLLCHPWEAPMSDSPGVSGLHVSPVNIATEDGLVIKGFLVPVFDENRLIRSRQAALTTRWPAVVLVADPFSDVSRLDGLIPALHDAGYVVLVGHLRDGRIPGTARTFGLHERFDIAAVVNRLLELNYVDASRISVVATGSAANAAILTRQTNPASIYRLVMYQPIESFDQILEQSGVPTGLRTACRWAFEVFYRVDAQDLELSQYRPWSDPDILVLNDHPARPTQAQRVLSFLNRPASTNRSPGVHDGLQD